MTENGLPEALPASLERLFLALTAGGGFAVDEQRRDDAGRLSLVLADNPLPAAGAATVVTITGEHEHWSFTVGIGGTRPAAMNVWRAHLDQVPVAGMTLTDQVDFLLGRFGDMRAANADQPGLDAKLTAMAEEHFPG